MFFMFNIMSVIEPKTDLDGLGMDLTSATKTGAEVCKLQISKIW